MNRTVTKTSVSVSFVLKKPKIHLNKNKERNETTIVFRVSEGRGMQKRYSTGYKVNPKYWDSSKQKIKNVAVISNSIEINNYLAGLKNNFNKSIANAVANGEAITKTGLAYEGGVIFYLNTSSGETLISSQFDQSKEAEWGCEGINIKNAESPNVGSDLKNTEAIVEKCNTQSIVANLCFSLVVNGKDDWYLPSKDELNLLYINLKARDLGNFDNTWYWSSTEFEDQANFDSTGFEAVWVQSFEDGAKVTYDVGVKRFKNNVRAIRKAE